MHVGSWRRVRRVYGETQVQERDGSRGSLREWCERHAGTRGDGEFQVLEVKKTESETEKMWVFKHQIEDGLSKVDDAKLEELWRGRKELHPKVRGMMIRKIWDELEIRHEGLTRRAIKIKIPYVHGLDTRRVKMELGRLIEEAGVDWPDYVRAWHRQNLSISTESRPSISDVMCNVSKPWKNMRVRHGSRAAQG